MSRALLLVLGFCVGCGLESKGSRCDTPAQEVSSASLTEQPTVSGIVSYETHIKSLIARACLSCHGKGGQPPALDSFETLTSNNNEVALAAMQEINEGDMPKLMPLSAHEASLFASWMQQEFPQKGGKTPDGRGQETPSKVAAHCR